MLRRTKGGGLGQTSAERVEILLFALILRGMPSFVIGFQLSTRRHGHRSQWAAVCVRFTDTATTPVTAWVHPILTPHPTLDVGRQAVFIGNKGPPRAFRSSHEPILRFTGASATQPLCRYLHDRYQHFERALLTFFIGVDSCFVVSFVGARIGIPVPSYPSGRGAR